MPEESILWDDAQVADWELEEALRFAPGTHPLNQASLFIPHSLYEWQRDMLAASCRSHSRAVISTANESGKTSVLIPVFGLAMMAAFPGCQVYSTSGSDRQVKEQLFEQQLKPMVDQEYMKKAGWKIKLGDSLKVSAPNGSSWLGYVCSNDLNAEGFHGYWREDEKTGEKRYCPCIYIVDEAKSVGDGVHEAIRRIDPDFWMTVSTPGKESGWFYEAIDPDTLRVNMEEYQTTSDTLPVFNKYLDPYGVDPRHDYTEDYENLDKTDLFNYRRMVGWNDCPHLHTKKKQLERKKILKKYGENSAFVKSMLYGQFQRSDEFNLIYTDDDLAAVKKAMRGDGKRIGKDIVAAGDISGGGDGQVFDLRIGSEIIHHDDHNCGSGIEQAEYWVNKLETLNIPPWKFNMDSAGLGSEVANYMEKRLDYSGINRIQANVGPQFKFEFRDKYTEIHFRIKELLSAGVLKLPHNENLIKQMRCRRFIEMESGHKLKTEDKRTHRKREKSSPDELDNLVYVFWDFDWSLLDVITMSEGKKPDENALTPMEKKAQESGTNTGRAFSKMRVPPDIHRNIKNNSALQKLRIGRR